QRPAAGRDVLVRREFPSRLLHPPATRSVADPQGPEDLSPRPCAMVAVPDLLRAAGLLFPQHPAAGLRGAVAVLEEPGQLPKSVRDGSDPLDLHQPVHLPAALIGGPEFLGPRPVPAATGADPLGQVRLFGRDRAPAYGVTRLLERPDARNGPL